MTVKTSRITMFAALAVAVFGLMPLTATNCGPIKVMDPVTGETRLATPEEAAAVAQAAGETLQVVTVAAGQPTWIPFVDIGMRMAALLFAWYQRREIDKALAPPSPP